MRVATGAMRAWAPPPWAGLTQPADTHAFSSTGDTFATWLLQTPKLARLFVDHIYLSIWIWIFTIRNVLTSGLSLRSWLTPCACALH